MASNYWSKDWYLEFSEALGAKVASDPNLLGLVLLGSTADTFRVDEWSDHDFFLITSEGLGEDYRQDLSWLPFADQIAWAPRETDHGLKVVYEFGHVLEFAVFNDSELELAKVNAVSVPVDKSNLAERVEKLRQLSIPAAPADLSAKLQIDLELLLSHLLIGVGRFRRGETLIAGEQIRSYLVPNLLNLISAWVEPAPGSATSEDNLNRFRRFEKRYPAAAAELTAALATDVETAARKVLNLVESLDPTTSNGSKYQVVRNRLGWEG
jgi:hypothetical protein